MNTFVCFFGAFILGFSSKKSASTEKVDVSPGTALNNTLPKKKSKKWKDMEEEKYCISLQRNEYGFSIFCIISSTHVHYLFLFYFVFVRLFLSHSFFCDKEKEEDTLVSRRRKARVYGKMRGAEQIFVCPLWRQKKDLLEGKQASLYNHSPSFKKWTILACCS